MPRKRTFPETPLPLQVVATLQLLGRSIATERKQRGMSQADFADHVGVSIQTMNSIERGAPTVQIGHYARAVWLLELPGSIFDSSLVSGATKTGSGVTR